MRKFRALVYCIAVALVSACAPLQHREIFVACETLDTATTLYAVRIGAVESNPLMVSLVAHPVFFVLFKGGLIWLAMRNWNQIEPAAQVALNVSSCIPVVNNVKVIREQLRLNGEVRKAGN